LAATDNRFFPEMLVRVENGIVETCPIAGTRKRGRTKKRMRLWKRASFR